MKPKKLQESAQSPTPVANATQKNSIASEAINESTRKEIIGKVFDSLVNGDKLFEDPKSLFSVVRGFLGEKLASQIENLKKPLRILVVGESFYKVQACVAYAYYFHFRCSEGKENLYQWEDRLSPAIQPYYACWWGIREIDCKRNSEEAIINELFQPPKSVNKVFALFLSGLEFKYNRVFYSILKKLTKKDTPHRMTGCIQQVETAFYTRMIAVHVEKTDCIPQEFLDETEKIYLTLTISFDDTTKTIIINQKKYSIPDRKYNLFKLLYENKEKLVSKREIMEHLETGGTWDESQVFKLITNLRTTFSECGIQFPNIKQTKNQTGGYQMIF